MQSTEPVQIFLGVEVFFKKTQKATQQSWSSFFFTLIRSDIFCPLAVVINAVSAIWLICPWHCNYVFVPDLGHIYLPT